MLSIFFPHSVARFIYSNTRATPARFDAFEKRMDVRFQAFEDKLDKFIAEMRLS
jgi:hypothetical protein